MSPCLPAFHHHTYKTIHLFWVNHSSHCCHCNIKKLLGLKLWQASAATKSNRMSLPTPRSAFCPCCNVCSDSSFMLLVRQEMLLILVYRHPTTSLFPWSLLPAFPFSHITWMSALAPIILEVTGARCP